MKRNGFYKGMHGGSAEAIGRSHKELREVGSEMARHEMDPFGSVNQIGHFFMVVHRT